MNKRRQAREFALQMLYQAEQTEETFEVVVENFYSIRYPHPDVRAYSQRLLKTVKDNIYQVDELLKAALINYKLTRLGIVERSLLRVCVAELMIGETDVKVVLDEAVEIGRDFVDEKAGGFVNGVLEKIARTMGVL
jgi:N utilization substance protein B